MFEFIVPDGDWDYLVEEKRFIHKPLVFTEKRRKNALEAFEEYTEEGIAFTMTFTPKEQYHG